MASLLRRRQPEDSYSPFEVDPSLLLSENPIAPSDLSAFLGEEPPDEHGPPILNAADTAHVLNNAKGKHATKAKTKQRMVHVESASTGQFYSTLEDQNVDNVFENKTKAENGSCDESFSDIRFNKGQAKAGHLLCGKLVIEQIFITCQALLAGLSLYPLIAAYAGNVNSEEFVSGYGPGARVTRQILFFLATVSLIGASNTASGLGGAVNRMGRRENVSNHSWSIGERTVLLLGAIAYGICLLSTLCCSPADAMMESFYESSLQDGYDGTAWPQNVLDNQFFNKSLDIWFICTTVRASTAFMGWMVTRFGLYKRGINAAE